MTKARRTVTVITARGVSEKYGSNMLSEVTKRLDKAWFDVKELQYSAGYAPEHTMRCGRPSMNGVDPEGFQRGGATCICGPLYSYGGHVEPGQFHPKCPEHSDEVES